MTGKYQMPARRNCYTQPHFDGGLVPSQPLAHLLRYAVEELKRKVRVRLEVLPVLLGVAKTLDDACRDNGVLNRLLNLVLEVSGMLNIRPQYRYRASEHL